jgi:hypothetical protein
MAGIVGAGERDAVLWETWRNKLESYRELHREYSCALLLAAAARFNRDERTIRRWLEDDPRYREVFELTEEHHAYIRLTGGNLAEAYKLARKAGIVDKSEKTFRRAFARLPNGIQAGLRGGIEAARAALPYVALPMPTRPGQIWEIDHTLLDEIVVRDPHTNRRGHPWLTIVIDVFSRMIVGFAITLGLRKEDGHRGAAKTESAFAALADAFLGRDYDGTFVGGEPGGVRFDQGKDFMNPVADALDRMGIGVEPVEAETPQHKPYVERVIGTIKRTVLPPLPGWGIELEDAA